MHKTKSVLSEKLPKIHLQSLWVLKVLYIIWLINCLYNVFFLCFCPSQHSEATPSDEWVFAYFMISNFKYRVNIAFPLWALFYMNIVFDLLKTKGIKIDLRMIFFVCVVQDSQFKFRTHRLWRNTTFLDIKWSQYFCWV